MTFTLKASPEHGAQLVLDSRRAERMSELLDDAGDAQNADHAYARAWSLLLRIDWTDPDTVAAFRDHVQGRDRDRRWHELQPLFALIAVSNPALVCDLFPMAAGPFVLSLCGEEGLRVALHELRSRDRFRREEAAFALGAILDAGLVSVPAAPIYEAHAREWHEDVRETLRSLLNAIEAKEAQAAAVTA